MIEFDQLVLEIKGGSKPDFILLKKLFSDEELLELEGEDIADVLHRFNDDLLFINTLKTSIEANGCKDVSTMFVGLALMQIRIVSIMDSYRVFQRVKNKAVGLPFLKELLEKVSSNVGGVISESTFVINENVPREDLPSTVRFKSQIPIDIIEFALKSFIRQHADIFNGDLRSLVEHEYCGDSNCFICYVKIEEDPLSYLESFSKVDEMREDLTKVDNDNSLYVNKNPKEIRSALIQITKDLLSLIRLVCGKNHNAGAIKSEKEIIIKMFDYNTLIHIVEDKFKDWATGVQTTFSHEKKVKLIEALIKEGSSL